MIPLWKVENPIYIDRRILWCTHFLLYVVFEYLMKREKGVEKVRSVFKKMKIFLKKYMNMNPYLGFIEAFNFKSFTFQSYILAVQRIKGEKYK